MRFAWLFFLALLVPFAAADDLDLPVDVKASYCSDFDTVLLPAWCAIVRANANLESAFSDTSNKLSSAEIEAGIVESDTARDVETAILLKDIDLSKERVSHAWANILSLVLLVVEVVEVLFYLAQLFIIVHLPYFYVKFLVWVKSRAFGYARSRRVPR